MDKILKMFLEIESFTKKEAENNPINKDLFQSGKQQAYSNIYFEIKKANKCLKDKYTDRLSIKIMIGVLSFCSGFLLCMYAFKLI